MVSLPFCNSAYGDMNQTKRDWIASLTEEYPLTPFDKIAPVGYFSQVYGFAHSEWDADFRSGMAILIAERLKVVIARFPFLGGQLILSDGQQEGSKLIYSRDLGSANISQGPNPLDTLYPCYVASEMLRFNVSNLKGHRLENDPRNESNLPFVTMAGLKACRHEGTVHPNFIHDTARATHYKNGHYLHPLILQATFLEDGLVLGFSAHHSVMDLTALTDVIAHFADPTTAAPFDLDAHLTRAHTLLSTPSNTPLNPLTDIASYSFDKYPDLLPPATGGKVPLLLTIPHAFLQPLHVHCDELVRQWDIPGGFVSRVDVISGLIWVVLTAARLRAWPTRLEPNGTVVGLESGAPSRFCTAVNVRGRLAGGAAYPGNAFVRVVTRADITIGSIVGADKIPVFEDVAHAALLIRNALRGMDKEWEGHVKMARMAVGLEAGGGRFVARPRDVGDAVARATERDAAGVDFSVNVTMGADILFDLPGLPSPMAAPGTKVRPDFVRFPLDRVGGCVRLLPRVGGTQGAEDWEVLAPVRPQEVDFVLAEFQRLVGLQFA
ncbi:hypothetical protein QBC39DRAFT_405775 [Podospora conica]|nr:hypothetical protein QBC39DRAFT_405775 [Schizothecium conicum]